MALNLLAPFNVAQAANAVMQTQDDGGAIINIGSVSAIDPQPGTRGVQRSQGRPPRSDQGIGPRMGAEGPDQPHHQPA